MLFLTEIRSGRSPGPVAFGTDWWEAGVCRGLGPACPAPPALSGRSGLLSVALMCGPRAFELPVPSPEHRASGKGPLHVVQEGRRRRLKTSKGGERITDFLLRHFLVFPRSCEVRLLVTVATEAWEGLRPCGLKVAGSLGQQEGQPPTRPLVDQQAPWGPVFGTSWGWKSGR